MSGFHVALLVDRRPLRTTERNGTTYALAAPGRAFEVAVSHANKATYMCRLEVDGIDAEPGYLKKERRGGGAAPRLCGGHGVCDAARARGRLEQRRRTGPQQQRRHHRHAAAREAGCQRVWRAGAGGRAGRTRASLPPPEARRVAAREGQARGGNSERLLPRRDV